MSPEQPQPDQIITHVPTAEELAAQVPQAQSEVEGDAMTRGALNARLAGEQGSAAELNAKYPSARAAEIPAKPAPKPTELPEPFIEPDYARTLRGDELKQLREQLGQQEQQQQ